MKFGCCTNMLPREAGSVGQEYLPALAELGYDYVELPLADLTILLDAQQKRELKKRLADTLPVYACNNFFANDIKLCGEQPTPMEKVSDYVKRALGTAEEFGVSIAVFGSPWAKHCPEGFPKSEAFKQLANVCSLIADEADRCNITVALEPNNTLETNMINTYSDVLGLVREVNHARIQGLQDYFHLKQEQVTVKSMIEGAEHLVHTHFARYEGRRFPKDMTEDTYYEVYFKTLKDIGYTGGISMEGFLEKKEDFRRDAKATLEFFKEWINMSMAK